MVYFKTALFTVLVPGTVVVLIPLWLLWRSAAASTATSVSATVGGIMIAAGALLYVACAFNFAALGRGTPSPLDPPKALVARGSYAFVRNPMYIGAVTIVCGEAVLFRAPLLLAYAALIFVAASLFIVLYEEPHLSRKFGPGYDEYRRRVPRWFPRVGHIRRGVG